MNYNKLVAAGLSASIFALSVVPAMASTRRSPRHEQQNQQTDYVSVRNETRAFVNVYSESESYTGANQASGNAGRVDITTGDASSESEVATFTGLNATTVIDPCPCGQEQQSCNRGCRTSCRDGRDQQVSGDTRMVSVNNDTVAMVGVYSSAVSDTGMNGATGNAGAVSMDTGDASSESEVVTVVGANITYVR